MPLKTHGVNASTPENLILGAGTFYKNLKFDGTDWDGEILGATSGGGSVKVTPEYFEPQIDGATVSIKGMVWKVSEEATIEANITEFNGRHFTDLLHLVEDPAKSVAGVHTCYVGRPNLNKGDYFDNIAYVGTLTGEDGAGLTGGKQIIIILPNAICLGAMELSPKDKENATYAVEFKCTATFEQESLNYLPVEIYYPE